MRLWNKAIRPVAVIVGALALPSLAAAATATTTFGVSATVQATCTVSASPLAFNTYTGSQVDATTTMEVTCTNTTEYDVGSNAGGGSGATVSARKMTDAGTNTLGYALFSNAGRTANWGNTVDTDTVAATGNGSAQTHTVYARIAGAQYVTPGTYNDTITVTVTYN